MRELLLGCGSRTTKDLTVNGSKDFVNVTRLDSNADHKPDIIWDLTNHPLPFADNSFDEIHCYDVLEHLAQQGDYKFFFKEFTEYHRILKPGGLFMASVPAQASPWAWGEPSHKRIISKESLVFLSQMEYRKQVGVTKMSDFRYLYKVDFVPVHANEASGVFYFVLKANK